MDLIEARFNRTARHPWELARLEVVCSLLRRLLSDAGNEPKHILDIGCGDAWLVEQLASRFPASRFLAVDHELNEQDLHAIRERVTDRCSVFRNLDEALSHQKEAVDLVLLLDVLEHVPDDDQFLRALRARPAITTDTRMVVTVPAWQALFCSHDRMLRHYRRYTTSLLCERLTCNGFEVEHTGYFFGSLLPVRGVQVLAERMQICNSPARGVGRSWSIPALDALIRAALVLDFKIGAALRHWGLRPPGLSAFAAARATKVPAAAGLNAARAA